MPVLLALKRIHHPCIFTQVYPSLNHSVSANPHLHEMNCLLWVKRKMHLFLKDAHEPFTHSPAMIHSLPTYLPPCLSACLPTAQPARFPIHPSVHLSVRPSIHPSIFPYAYTTHLLLGVKVYPHT